ncbi:hypothetical protein P154DRAFT_521982 [Amniculicola lignicola CBS 123094]|uniref:CFEM domain-containing protein n=1 Tax=Amniculicola lignicola CBS 123094 TaxID=1392246 RepID=A0A6A5WK27_9PLEO|nr:hypothetical protein P154DRAFT_521982 [Amniculicola lignicola CBS 123094]
MRTTITFLAPLLLALCARKVESQSPADRIKGLPVCAQSCITGAFSRCGCKILDFSCACSCAAFRPFSQSCTDSSCSDSYLKPVLDAIEGTCSAFSSTPIALPATSTTPPTSTTTRQSVSMTTHTSQHPTTTVIASISKEEIIIPGTPTEQTLYTLPSTTVEPSPLSPSYCWPIVNATGHGWNATATCTGLYHGPVYTGSARVAKSMDVSWMFMVVFSAAGYFS